MDNPVYIRFQVSFGSELCFFLGTMECPSYRYWYVDQVLLLFLPIIIARFIFHSTSQSYRLSSLALLCWLPSMLFESALPANLLKSTHQSRQSQTSAAISLLLTFLWILLVMWFLPGDIFDFRWSIRCVTISNVYYYILLLGNEIMYFL